MIGPCIRDGLKAAARRPALVLVLWAWHALLAGVAALPAWRWWSSVFDQAPEADRLLGGFHFGLFRELMQDGGASIWGVLGMAAAGAIVLALVSQSLVVGGILEVLLADDARSFWHRFFRGAGHFFGRFVRVLAAGGLVMVVVAGLIDAGLSRLFRPLVESAWEPAEFVTGLVRTGLALMVVVYFLLALDYARIRIAIEDSRRALRIWLASLGFVLAHPLATSAIWAASSLLWFTVLATYGVYRGAVPASTWALIGLMVVAQQLVMLARAGLRVAGVAGALEFYRRASVSTGVPAPTARTPTPIVDEPPLVAEPTVGPGAEGSDVFIRGGST